MTFLIKNILIVYIFKIDQEKDLEAIFDEKFSIGGRRTSKVQEASGLLVSKSVLLGCLLIALSVYYLIN